MGEGPGTASTTAVAGTPSTPPLSSARLWAITGVSLFAMALPSMPSLSLGVLAPFMVEDFGITSVQLGLVPLVLFLGASIFSGRVGALADRLAPRLLVGAVFVGSGLVLAGMALAPSFPWLLVAAAVGILPLSLCNPATNTLLVRFAAVWRHQALATGVKQSGVQTAAVFSGVVLPPLALASGWRTSLLVVAGVALAGLVVVGLVPRTEAPRGHGRHGRLPAWVTPLTIYAFCLGLAVSCTTIHLPLYTVRVVGWDPAMAGQAAAALGALGLLSRLLLVRLATTAERARVLLVGLAAGGTAAMSLVASAAWLGGGAVWLGAMLFGATAVAWNAVGMATIIQLSRPDQAGSASGRVLSGFFGGFAVGPPFFGLLVDFGPGYLAGWTLAAAACLVALTVLHRVVFTHDGEWA